MLTLSVLHPFNDKGYCSNSAVFQRSLKKELKDLVTINNIHVYDYRQLEQKWEDYIDTSLYVLSSIVPARETGKITIKITPVVTTPVADWLSIFAGGFKEICDTFAQPLSSTMELDIKKERVAVGQLGEKHLLSAVPKWATDRNLKKDKKSLDKMIQTQLMFTVSRNVTDMTINGLALGLADDGNVCAPGTGVLQTQVQVSGNTATLTLYRCYSDGVSSWRLVPLDGKDVTVVQLQ